MSPPHHSPFTSLLSSAKVASEQLSETEISHSRSFFELLCGKRDGKLTNQQVSSLDVMLKHHISFLKSVSIDFYYLLTQFQYQICGPSRCFAVSIQRKLDQNPTFVPLHLSLLRTFLDLHDISSFVESFSHSFPILASHATGSEWSLLCDYLASFYTAHSSSSSFPQALLFDLLIIWLTSSFHFALSSSDLPLSSLLEYYYKVFTSCRSFFQNNARLIVPKAQKKFSSYLSVFYYSFSLILLKHGMKNPNISMKILISVAATATESFLKDEELHLATSWKFITVSREISKNLNQILGSPMKFSCQILTLIFHELITNSQSVSGNIFPALLINWSRVNISSLGQIFSSNIEDQNQFLSCCGQLSTQKIEISILLQAISDGLTAFISIKNISKFTLNSFVLQTLLKYSENFRFKIEYFTLISKIFNQFFTPSPQLSLFSRLNSTSKQIIQLKFSATNLIEQLSSIHTMIVFSIASGQNLDPKIENLTQLLHSNTLIATDLIPFLSKSDPYYLFLTASYNHGVDNQFSYQLFITAIKNLAQNHDYPNLFGLSRSIFDFILTHNFDRITSSSQLISLTVSLQRVIALLKLEFFVNISPSSASLLLSLGLSFQSKMMGQKNLVSSMIYSSCLCTLSFIYSKLLPHRELFSSIKFDCFMKMIESFLLDNNLTPSPSLPLLFSPSRLSLPTPSSSSLRYTPSAKLQLTPRYTRVSTPVNHTSSVAFSSYFNLESTEESCSKQDKEEFNDLEEVDVNIHLQHENTHEKAEKDEENSCEKGDFDDVMTTNSDTSEIKLFQESTIPLIKSTAGAEQSTETVLDEFKDEISEFEDIDLPNFGVKISTDGFALPNQVVDVKICSENFEAPSFDEHSTHDFEGGKNEFGDDGENFNRNIRNQSSVESFIDEQRACSTDFLPSCSLFSSPSLDSSFFPTSPVLSREDLTRENVEKREDLTREDVEKSEDLTREDVQKSEDENEFVQESCDDDKNLVKDGDQVAEVESNNCEEPLPCQIMTEDQGSMLSGGTNYHHSSIIGEEPTTNFSPISSELKSTSTNFLGEYSAHSLQFSENQFSDYLVSSDDPNIDPNISNSETANNNHSLLNGTPVDCCFNESLAPKFDTNPVEQASENQSGGISDYFDEVDLDDENSEPNIHDYGENSEPNIHDCDENSEPNITQNISFEDDHIDNNLNEIFPPDQSKLEYSYSEFSIKFSQKDTPSSELIQEINEKEEKYIEKLETVELQGENEILDEILDDNIIDMESTQQSNLISDMVEPDENMMIDISLLPKINQNIDQNYSQLQIETLNSSPKLVVKEEKNPEISEYLDPNFDQTDESKQSNENFDENLLDDSVTLENKENSCVETIEVEIEVSQDGENFNQNSSKLIGSNENRQEGIEKENDHASPSFRAKNLDESDSVNSNFEGKISPPVQQFIEKPQFSKYFDEISEPTTLEKPSNQVLIGENSNSSEHSEIFDENLEKKCEEVLLPPNIEVKISEDQDELPKSSEKFWEHVSQTEVVELEMSVEEKLTSEDMADDAPCCCSHFEIFDPNFDQETIALDSEFICQQEKIENVSSDSKFSAKILTMDEQKDEESPQDQISVENFSPIISQDKDLDVRIEIDDSEKISENFKPKVEQITEIENLGLNFEQQDVLICPEISDQKFSGLEKSLNEPENFTPIIDQFNCSDCTKIINENLTELSEKVSVDSNFNAYLVENFDSDEQRDFVVIDLESSREDQEENSSEDENFDQNTQIDSHESPKINNFEVDLVQENSRKVEESIIEGKFSSLEEQQSSENLDPIIDQVDNIETVTVAPDSVENLESKIVQSTPHLSETIEDQILVVKNHEYDESINRSEIPDLDQIIDTKISENLDPEERDNIDHSLEIFASKIDEDQHVTTDSCDNQSESSKILTQNFTLSPSPNNIDQSNLIDEFDQNTLINETLTSEVEILDTNIEEKVNQSQTLGNSSTDLIFENNLLVSDSFPNQSNLIETEDLNNLPQSSTDDGVQVVIESNSEILPPNIHPQISSNQNPIKIDPISDSSIIQALQAQHHRRVQNLVSNFQPTSTLTPELARQILEAKIHLTPLAYPLDRHCFPKQQTPTTNDVVYQFSDEQVNKTKTPEGFAGGQVKASKEKANRRGSVLSRLGFSALESPEVNRNQSREVDRNLEKAGAELADEESQLREIQEHNVEQKRNNYSSPRPGARKSKSKAKASKRW
ncbi:hypothetical protein RCL1_009064 [Eukaryota sp. TZLM3-RCL]